MLAPLTLAGLTLKNRLKAAGGCALVTVGDVIAGLRGLVPEPYHTLDDDNTYTPFVKK